MTEPFSVLRDEVMADPQRAARVEQIKENVMIEVEKYQAKAAVAADAMAAALRAVEECGADVQLTSIVRNLGDDRTKLCRLFDLPPDRISAVDYLAEDARQVADVARRLGNTQHADEKRATAAVMEKHVDTGHTPKACECRHIWDAHTPFRGCEVCSCKADPPSQPPKPGPQPPPIAPGDTARYA